MIYPTVFAIFGVLLIKHVVVDYQLQKILVDCGYLTYANKGNILAWDGYFHSLTNVLGSLVVSVAYITQPINLATINLIALLLVGEFASHYILDYSKLVILNYYPIIKDTYIALALTAFDQAMHLTYLAFFSYFLAKIT